MNRESSAIREFVKESSQGSSAVPAGGLKSPVDVAADTISFLVDLIQVGKCLAGIKK